MEKHKVAEAVNYPLPVRFEGKKEVIIQNQRQFLKYNKIITPSLIRAISARDIKDEHPAIFNGITRIGDADYDIYRFSL